MGLNSFNAIYDNLIELMYENTEPAEWHVCLPIFCIRHIPTLHYDQVLMLGNAMRYKTKRAHTRAHETGRITKTLLK